MKKSVSIFFKSISKLSNIVFLYATLCDIQKITASFPNLSCHMCEMNIYKILISRINTMRNDINIKAVYVHFIVGIQKKHTQHSTEKLKIKGNLIKNYE